jgi:hypothetical protein
MPSSYDLFLSYKQAEDGIHAKRLASQLELRGLRVFVDNSAIKEFSSIGDEINNGIRNSKAFLAWYSQAYLQSTACFLELARAIALHGLHSGGRVMVVNPHSTIDHVHPIWLRGSRCYALPSKNEGAIEKLAATIADHITKQPELATEQKFLASQNFGHMPTTTFERLVAFRHAELFGIFDAFHANEASDVTRRVAPNPVVISGPEGIGKSHCAHSYASMLGSVYPGGVYWFDAGKSSDATQAAQNLADQMLEAALESGWISEHSLSGGPLTSDPATNLRYLRAIARSRLARGEPFLWIVENLPTEMASDFDMWRAPTSNGRTLATTLVEPDLDGLKVVSLRALAISDIEQILRLSSPDATEPRHIRQLAEMTEGYLGHLRVIEAEIAAFGAERTCDLYKAATASTIGIADAYRPLISLCQDDERELLATLVAMGPALIPYSVVSTILSDTPSEHDNRALAGTLPISALKKLSTHALVSLSAKNGVKVEAPVRRLAREFPDILPVAAARRPAMQALCRLLPANTRARLTPEFSALITHARQLVSSVDSDEAALLLQRIGTFDALIGDQAGERASFERSYHWFEDAYGAGHRKSLEALLEVNACYKHDPSENERVDNALKIAMEALGEEDEIVIRLLHSRSIILGDQYRVDEALKVAEHAEKLAQSSLGAEHGITLQVRTSKALFLHQLRRVNEARIILEDLDTIESRLFGVDHPDRLRVAANLALVLSTTDPERALAIEKEVLRTFHANYGRKHHLTTWAAYNLICRNVQLRLWQDARRLVLQYFAWLLKSDIAHQSPARYGLLEVGRWQNPMHVHYKRVLVEAYAHSRDYYLERSRDLWSPQFSRSWAEWALTIEYLLHGTDALSFEIILGDYLEASRRHPRLDRSKFCQRMIGRWKRDHTFRSPFSPFMNPQYEKEIENLMHQIRITEWEATSIQQKIRRLCRRSTHDALKWKPGEAKNQKK